MSSFVMSKAEVIVLFDLLGLSSLPTGVRDLPEVGKYEYKRIVDKFVSHRLIDLARGYARPDIGLERFLFPMINTERIMIFHYGADGSCSFNSTLYFAKNGLTAVLDMKDAVKFLTISSSNDLLLFIPEISPDKNHQNGGEYYISYMLFEKGDLIFHCTRMNYQRNLAKIVEGKRNGFSELIENGFETDISEYQELIHDKLKEVYDAAGC